MTDDGGVDGSAVRVPRVRAFAEFCVLERARLCATVRVLSGGHRDAEDAVQEALLLARHRWADVGGYAHPEAWVVKVALRQVGRWRRREHVPGPVVDPVDDRAQQAFDRAEGSSDLAVAIAALPRRQREVITLHYRLDLPVEQIADVLDLRPSTVRGALSRGRDELALRWNGGLR